jgi:hypothetical protein
MIGNLDLQEVYEEQDEALGHITLPLYTSSMSQKELCKLGDGS